MCQGQVMRRLRMWFSTDPIWEIGQRSLKADSLLGNNWYLIAVPA